MRLLEDWRLPASGIYAVYTFNRLVARKVRRFVQHLAQRLKAELPVVPDDCVASAGC